MWEPVPEGELLQEEYSVSRRFHSVRLCGTSLRSGAHQGNERMEFQKKETSLRTDSWGLCAVSTQHQFRGVFTELVLAQSQLFPSLGGSGYFVGPGH